jgi:hypothetical protein
MTHIFSCANISRLVKAVVISLLLMNPALGQTPFLSQQPEGYQMAQTRERKFGRAVVAVERPVRLEIDNRTTGLIKVIGWDRDAVEARAFSERGDEVVIFRATETGVGRSLYFKADYADLETPGAPEARVLDEPPYFGSRPLQVHLEVNVPRYAELDEIRVIQSNVEITGLNTPVKVIGNRSSVVIRQVGAAYVFTRTGSIDIEDTNGPVEVATGSGAVRLSRSTGAARIVAIAGSVEVKCSRGRIDVASTHGPIDLENVEGEVDAVATTSSVRFRGRLGSKGRYLLKSMSGTVEMILASDTEGFDALLTSYLGLVEADFPLAGTEGLQPESEKRRLAGKFRNGGPQVTLDSFDGLVRITRAASNAASTCK